MADTPIFDSVAKDKPCPEKPRVLYYGTKYWGRRKKKAKALTDRVWKEICDQWNAHPSE